MYAGQGQGVRAGTVVSRLPEVLEGLKTEFEQLSHEASVYKAQRDENERKLEAQLTELSLLQQSLSELERTHLKIKQNYEEEILRLRRQLETGMQIDTNGLGGAKLSKGLDIGGVGLTGLTASALSHAHASESSDSSAIRDSAERRAAGGAGGPGHMGDTSKAVDAKGRPMEDWTVVHNPTSRVHMSLELQHTLDHDSVVCCVRFSGDGRYLATGCNKSAVLYDAETGRRVGFFAADNVLDTQAQVDAAHAGDSYVRSVCFSPDGRFLVAGAEDKAIRIWDIVGRRLRTTLHGHGKDIYSVDYAADGRHIASGSGDRRAKIWDASSGECVRTYGDDDGPKDGVTSVAVSPDGRLLAAGSLDRVVRLWDTETGALLDKFDGHTDSVYSVSFSPDGAMLASGSLDKTLKLWDLSEAGRGAGGGSAGRCRHTFQGHKDFVLSVVFAPQGNWLISGSKDRSVQFWDPRHGTGVSAAAADEAPVLILQGHQNSVISVSHSPAGRMLATGSGDKRARVWRYTQHDK